MIYSVDLVVLVTRYNTYACVLEKREREKIANTIYSYLTD